MDSSISHRSTDCPIEHKELPIVIPMQEILGSVTTFNSVEGCDQTGGKAGQQLRTSARVIKKMKLDNTQSQAIAAQEKEKKDCLNSKDDTDKNEKPEIKPDLKVKVNRPKVVWSAEDKSLFFEAVKEFGRDFDAIHDYIVNKYKKKGIPDMAIKTKDQVRHFYYRTWQKVTKHLKFSDEVKKVAQEYYALINYGELRRKVGVGLMNEKLCVKLNELMYRGSVQIRIRGKSLRVKTPMCRMLRKLNQMDEKHDDLKLPAKVTVELRPRDMNTWMYVQSMGQNPCVHCSMPLQKRLQVLLSCLNSRWRTQAQRAQDKLESTHLLANVNHSASLSSDMEDQKLPLDPILRFAPSSTSHVEIPSINFSEYLTSCGISLNAYEERMGIKNRGEPLWLATHHSFKGGGKSNLKRGGKRVRNDSFGEKTSIVKKEANSETDCDTESKEVSEVVDSVVNTILNLKHENNSDIDIRKMEDESVNDEAKSIIEKEKAVEAVRKGWTLQDSESISIGELYLMMGSNSKIELTYWWESPLKTEVFEKSETEETELIKTNVTDDNFTKIANELSVTLQKLLSLAKLHYRKEKIKCHCGHVCGAPTGRRSLASQNKPAVSSKTVSKNVSENNSTDTNVEETSIINIPAQRFSDNMFRRPILPHPNPIRPNASIEAFKAQLDSLKPRYCNRRGRNVRSKQVVVQRMLPLLPKTPANGHSVLTMKVIQQGSLGNDFIPIAPKLSNMQNKPEQNFKPTQQSIALSPIPIDESGSLRELVDSRFTECVNDRNINTLKVTTDSDSPCLNISVPSPTPTISNFLDLELQDDNRQSGTNVDSSNMLLTDTNSDMTSFADLLPQDVLQSTTPPSSPSQIFKENDNQWLNSEVADFSLSSFLGHLESPLKPSTSSIPSNASIVGDDTRMSQDVEAQLQSLMSESSIDYMAKFADLAAQVASDSVKK